MIAQPVNLFSIYIEILVGQDISEPFDSFPIYIWVAYEKFTGSYLVQLFTLSPMAMRSMQILSSFSIPQGESVKSLLSLIG